MSDRSEEIVDLISGAEVDARRGGTVADRITQRKKVLKEWLENGIPAGKSTSLPTSLREARDWHDPELGVFRIGSPNEFTKTHPTWGEEVRDIAVLLTRLQKKYRRPKSKSASADRATVAKMDRKEADRQLEAAVSQWHSERDACLRNKTRAEAAEARVALLLAENRQKDAEIADLRRKLASRDGLKVAE